MQKLKSSEQIEEDILGVRSQISQWWDKCYYGKEQRTLCRPFFDGKLTLLYLDFPDTWIYKPKWYLVWNKSCYHFYPIFIFEEKLTSSNLTALKKEEAKLRKFYEKNRHIFDNIHESLQRVCLNHVCTSDWTTT